MKLQEYLNLYGEAVPAFAARAGRARVTVYRWLAGRTPRPADLQAIFDLTDGQVTANDFVHVEAAAPARVAA